MTTAAHIESLWRYPVKSMAGEQLQRAFIGFAGVFGDRLYAFHSAAAPRGFPYLTGREQEQMLLYHPRFRNAQRAENPVNLTEAESMGSGVTPVYPELADLIVDVETPAGETVSIDDPRLVAMLSEGIRDSHAPTLMRSERAMTDCRPVSLISIQTVRQIGKEVGIQLDQRRFRANLYVDLGSENGFAEDKFVGRQLRIGPKAVVAILERDSRCKMITLDPDTAQPSPEVMKNVARSHEGNAGVYAAVLVEGTVRPDDEVVLLD
jgi:hypothetical protein